MAHTLRRLIEAADIFYSGLRMLWVPEALITANFSVTREAVRRVGVFNTDLGRFATGLLCGEDIEFCHRVQRAGGHVYYDGRAVVVHLVPEARLTRRFFRSRAVWEGRTDALLLSSANRAPSLRRLGSTGLIMTKDAAIALAQVATGNARAAFEHELAARKRFGYLQQTFTARRRFRRTSATRQALAGGGPSLKVRVVNDWEGLQALGGPWSDLVARADVSIFQTFEWQATWSRLLADDASLHVVTVWDGADLVGIAPLSLGSVSFAGVPVIRRMRFLGRGDSDYLDLIVARGYETPVAERLAEHLVASSGLWDILDLEDVPEDSPAVAPFLVALAEEGCQIRRTLQRRCFAIDLPRAAPDYLATLNARTRKNLVRERRRLFDAGVQFEALGQHAALDGAIDDFLTLHERRWAREGRAGAVADERRRRFHHEVARLFHEHGWLALHFLKADGQRIAAEYSFQYGDRIFLYLTGFDPESATAKYSPGNVLLLCSIEAAIARGIRVYDLMRGAEAYKQSLGARERDNWRYEISAPGIVAACRIGAHMLIGKTWRLPGRLRRRAAATLHAGREGRR